MRISGQTAFLALALLLPSFSFAAISPSSEKLLNDGVIALYDLDYETSRASFRKIIETEPDNPFGYLFESAAIWWQSSQEYGLFKDTPTLQGQFERDIDMALKKAAPLLKSKDPAERADALFASGMALGTLGQWSLMRGHWIKACLEGHKAIKDLNKCVKADPHFEDAYLGLGVYDYQAARLPAVLKMSALLCGAHGDEKRGLARIRETMDKGRYASRQAREFLFSIYLTDLRDYAQSLVLLEKLRQDFPSSPYFQFLEIALRERTGDADGSIKEAKDFFSRYQADLKSLNAKWLTLVCGMEGADCLSRDDLARADAWLSKALDDDKTDGPPNFNTDAWLSLNHLLRGYVLNALGRNADAGKDYDWVLAHPDFSDFHARARECAGSPCAKPMLLSYLRTMSRGDAWVAKSAKAVMVAQSSAAVQGVPATSK